jgi:hypothetical protein
MAAQSERQASAEIEVTPEMLRAGSEAYSAYWREQSERGADDASELDLVCRVYEAMECRRRSLLNQTEDR